MGLTQDSKEGAPLLQAWWWRSYRAVVIPATSSRDGGHILGTQLAPAANSPGIQEEEEEEQRNRREKEKRGEEEEEEQEEEKQEEVAAACVEFLLVWQLPYLRKPKLVSQENQGGIGQEKTDDCSVCSSAEYTIGSLFMLWELIGKFSTGPNLLRIRTFPPNIYETSVRFGLCLPIEVQGLTSQGELQKYSRATMAL